MEDFLDRLPTISFCKRVNDSNRMVALDISSRYNGKTLKKWWIERLVGDNWLFKICILLI
jgi:hypothetical protein